MLASARPLPAAEWYFQPNLLASTLFDTNYQTSAGNPKSTVGLIYAPQAQLGRRTETLDLSVHGAATLSRFKPRSDLNRHSRSFGARGTQLFERGDATLALGWSQTTVQDAIDETDSVNPTGVLTTLRTLSATSSGVYRLTPVDTLSLSGGYSNRKFDSPNLVSSRAYFSSATWSHAISERLSGFAGTSASRTVADNAGNTINHIFYLNFGAIYQFTERLRLRGSSGPGVTTSTATTGGNRKTQSGFAKRFDVGVNYAYDEVTQIDLSFSQSTEPGSGTATNVSRRRAGLLVTRQLGPRLFGAIGVGLTQSQLSDTLERDSYSFEPSLNWQLDEKWSLRSSYRYRRTITTDQATGNTTAQSHGLYLTLASQLLPWTWSGR